MITETRPLTASLFGLAAVFFGVLAWKKAEWNDLTRLLFAGIALVYGVIFLAWVIELFGYLLTRSLAQARAAWYSPIVRQLELIRSIVKTELVCPQFTGLKCPLFNVPFVHSAASILQQHLLFLCLHPGLSQ